MQKIIKKPIFIKYQSIKKFKEDKNKNDPPKRNILKYQKKNNNSLNSLKKDHFSDKTSRISIKQ